QGRDGSAQALSGLHKPVHAAAAALRRPPLGAKPKQKHRGPGFARGLFFSSFDETQTAIERAKYAAEIGAAFQDQAGRRDHAISALPPRQLRRLLDAVERRFRGAPE